MRNPNWRRRPEDGGSCSSILTELEYCGVKASEKQASSKEASASISSDSTRFSRIPVSSDRILCFPQKQDFGNEFPKRDYKNPGKQFDNPANDGPYHEEKTGLYEIVKHVNLPGIQSQGKPTSIMELAPFTGTKPLSGQLGHKQDAFFWNIVQARRILKENTESQKHSFQYKPVCFAESKNNVKSPRPRQDFETGHEEVGIKIPTSTAGVEKARKAVLEDPAVADVGGCHRVSEVDRLGECLGSLTTQDHSKQKKLTEKQLAFQRMLNRLNKGSAQGTKLHETRNGPVHEQARPYHLGKNAEQRAFASRYPGSQAVRDSALGNSGSSSGIHEKEESNDSAIFIDSKCQPKNLNPRAREFLSYKHHSCDIQEPNPVLGHRLGSVSDRKTNSTDEPIDDGSSGRGSTGDLNVPFPIIKNNAIQQLNSLLPLGFVGPFSIPTTPPLAPVLNLTQPSGATTYPPQGLQFTVPPGLSTSLAPTYPLPTLGFSPPPVPGFNTSLPGPTVSNRPLMPVQKPRKPDAATQQAYEAYLEWRKTNEPGYAMECKRRQQRRAQRQTFNPPQPGASGKPSVTA